MVLKLPQVVPYEFLGLVDGFRTSYYEDLAGLKGGEREEGFLGVLRG